MDDRILRYSAGNEHNPADPVGRYELTVHGGGRAGLVLHHSRRAGTSAWAGRVAAPELAALWRALDEAGFPGPPPLVPVPPDSLIRRLSVEQDGATGSVLLAGLPARWETVIGLLDGLIGRLSQGPG